MTQEAESNNKGEGLALPPGIAEFLARAVDGSAMRLEVLRFFQYNPYAIVTISDLTIWTSRDEKPLGDTLQQLARLGYLEQSQASAAYVLGPDWEKRRQLEAFFAYLEDHRDVARLIRRHIRPSGEAE